MVFLSRLRIVKCMGLESVEPSRGARGTPATERIGGASVRPSMIQVVKAGASKSPPTEALAQAGQLLEDQHLVAWSRNASHRERFGLEMAWYLQRMPQSQTCVLAGSAICDLDGFCRQLAMALPGGAVHPRIDGPGGVIDRLRQRPRELSTRSDSDIIKHRYYVWRDADVLLHTDAALFGRLVDALAGVAAEAEYAVEDRLVIHRVLFIGGPALGLYAEDPRGQFQCWASDGAEEPLWRTVTGLSVPPMMCYVID